MKTDDFRTRRNGRHRIFSLPIIIIALWADSTLGAGSGAPLRYQESGELNEIEKNNSTITAIFSEKRYSVASSALNINAAARPFSPDRLPTSRPSELRIQLHTDWARSISARFFHSPDAGLFCRSGAADEL